MTPDTILTLGDFQFSRYEVPERIPFGGDQMLAVHQLVGGARIVDSMGRADSPVEWSGLFFGQNAAERAQFLDGLRIAGAALPLKWYSFDYTVVIQRFHANFERKYQVPYSITCLVVQDNAQPTTNILDGGMDDFIAQDQATADGLVAGLGDGPLSSLMVTLDGAIASVSSFATAAQSTINSVLQPLAAVQGRAAVLLAAVNNTVANVSTIGGVLPGNPVSQTALGMLSQVNAATQIPQLLQLRNVLGRMGANLGSVNRSQNTVTQAGGNLYTLAEQQYGDATAWTAIAQANKLTDPQLAGVTTLSIPPDSGAADGVLNA